MWKNVNERISRELRFRTRLAGFIRIQGVKQIMTQEFSFPSFCGFHLINGTEGELCLLTAGVDETLKTSASPAIESSTLSTVKVKRRLSNKNKHTPVIHVHSLEQNSSRRRRANESGNVRMDI